VTAIVQRSTGNWIAILLTLLVTISAITVAVVMFTPSDRDAVIAALTETGEEILAAAKTYPERSHLFEPEIPDDAMGATGSSPMATGPFSGLRFDRIGYFDHLSADARTYFDEVGRFSLRVSPDGQSFTLIAVGPEEVSIQWDGRVEEGDDSVE
jgi:hypothetical protein